MQTIDFDQFDYVPSILCDPVGQLAYHRLSVPTKMGVLALFELTWRPWASDFDKPLDFLSSLKGPQPFLLDIDKRRAPDPYLPVNPRDPPAALREFNRKKAAQQAFNAALNRLLRPDNGFFNWRRLISFLPNCIPVLQVTNVAAQREEFMKQLELLCVGETPIALRIGLTTWERLSPLMSDVLLSVRDVRHLLVIIDCGQGRARLPQRVALLEAALKDIAGRIGRRRMRELRFVCMSNSFTLPGHKGLVFKENFDREIWWHVNRDLPMAFGDYAATQRDSAHSSFRPWDYRAAVTHSLAGGWLISRHANRNDPTGWIEGCKEVERDIRFKPLSSWCDSTIKTTADIGELASEEPQVWHATRVNGHIERQFTRVSR